MKDIYIFPTQHFDLVWRRSNEYYREVRTRVIRKALEILNKHDGYRFFLDQAEVIDEFMKLNPDCADELSGAIKAGKLVICGGGWTIADVNLICGETIVRNLLHGKRWFFDNFGVEITCGSYVDAFGTCGQLPQIMKKLGEDCCIPGRTSMFDGSFQYGSYGCYLWEGIDGTQVVSGVGAMGQMSHDGISAFHGYGVMEGYDELYRELGDDPVLARKNIETGLRELMGLQADVFFTEFMGEEHTPSDLLTEVTDELNSQSEDCRFHITSPDVFFGLIDRHGFPVIKGEFNPIFTGCYSTRTGIKQGVRRAEAALLSEESLQVLDGVLCGASPKADLRPAWRDLSYAAFHDAVCGCHIDETAADIYARLSRVMESCGHEIGGCSLSRIAGSVCAPPDSYMILNTLGFARKEAVTLPGVHNVRIIDSADNIIPSAEEADGTVFLAELPPMGYSCYRAMRTGQPEAVSGSKGDSIAGEKTFETPRYRVKVGRQRLYVFDSLLGKRLDTDGMPVCSLVFGEDSGNMWVERLTDKKTDESAGTRRLVSSAENDVCFRVVYAGEIDAEDAGDSEDAGGSKAVGCSKDANGSKDAGGSKAADGSEDADGSEAADGSEDAGNSEAAGGAGWDGAKPLKWQKQYTFYREMERIDIDLKIDWSGKNSTVLAEFPCAFVSGGGKAMYDVPFGSQERQPYAADYKENTGGSWPAVYCADYSDSLHGLTVANTGTPAHRIEDNVIRVTMLRSGSDWSVPAFPFEPGEGSFENGTHSFRFSVTPHTGGWAGSRAFESGMAINRPPVAVKIQAMGSALPADFSFVRISEPNVVLSACKPSESGDAIVLRLYEYFGKPTAFSMTVDAEVAKAVETDLTETKQLGIVDLSNLTIRPYEIKTIVMEIV